MHLVHPGSPHITVITTASGGGGGNSSFWNLTPKQAPFSHIRPHSVRKESGRHSPFPMLTPPRVGSEAPCSDCMRILPSGLSPGLLLPIWGLAHPACPPPFPSITALGAHLPPGLHPWGLPCPLGLSLGVLGPPRPKECASNTSPRCQPCPPSKPHKTLGPEQGQPRPEGLPCARQSGRQTVPSLPGTQVTAKSRECGDHRGGGSLRAVQGWGGCQGLPDAPSSWHQLCSARSPMAEP